MHKTSNTASSHFEALEPEAMPGVEELAHHHTTTNNGTSSTNTASVYYSTYYDSLRNSLTPRKLVDRRTWRE